MAITPALPPFPPTLVPRRLAQAMLLAPIALSGPQALAETSATFDIAAQIVPGCLVDGLGSSGNAGHIGTLDFGSDSSLSTATHNASLSGSQTIRLRCTPGVAVTIAIDGGSHVDAGSRHLQRGGDSNARIAYIACRDAACTLPIAIGGTATVAVTSANSEDVRLPIFAALTLPGALPPGIYSDQLTVTLTW